MEIFNDLGRSILLIFNQKNFKKYISGELEPTEQELKQINLFIQSIFSEKQLNNTESDSYEKRLARQIEQKQVPYLKELLPEELDFLLRKEISLDRILDIIYAQYKTSKGLAAIEWKPDKEKYILKNESKSKKFSAIVVMLGLSFLLIWLGIFETINYRIYEINIFCLSILIFVLFIIFPLILRVEHAHESAAKLLKNHPEIFDYDG